MATKTKAAPTGALVEEDADPASLVENPRNPNTHPEEQLDRLMASLRARGQNRPILARKANRMLVAGHGIRMAVMRLGWTSIKVALWDVDQATADQAMLADNRLGSLSQPDDDRVAELLREMPQGDWFAVGFSTEEASKMLLGFEADQVEVQEVDVTPVEDKFWVSIYGPLERQAEALQHLKAMMGTWPGVTIELGTTTGF